MLTVLFLRQVCEPRPWETYLLDSVNPGGPDEQGTPVSPSAPAPHFSSSPTPMCHTCFLHVLPRGFDPLSDTAAHTCSVLPTRSGVFCTSSLSLRLDILRNAHTWLILKMSFYQ